MAFAVHGRARAPLLAFAAVFLLAFGDFEMASLFGVPAWTVRLFRAQVGGLPLASSLQLALAPAACEAIVLGAGLLILIRTRRTAPGQLAGQTVIKTTGSIGVWCCLAVSFTCVCVVPAVLLGPHTWSAMGTLAQEMQIASYLRASIVFAATTTIVAWFAAHWVTRRGGVSVMGLALCVPGLFGALVIGLCVLWLFQMPAWQMFYDTPAPLLMALMALMLPIAVLLRLLLAAHRTSPAIHVVRLLAWSPNAPLRRAAASLQWHMRGRMHLAALLLLFVWAFFDVVASAMLAPIDMTPASVLLYNQMHYGRSAMLSAMVCVTVLTPVLLAMMVFACRRALGRWWPAYE
jgi:ABC-type Fe3+ transport system permease subunit